MEWNGRQYRPIGRQVRNTKPDYKEMIKPYGQKENNGNVWIPVLSIPGNVPQPSSGPSPFDPSSITGLKLWFDADDTSTLSLSGNLVESWTSKGDVPMVLTATTSVRRPEYITTGGTGSSPALMFFSSSTAANRSLLTQASTSNSFNLTQGYTIFMAQKNAGSKSVNGVYGNFSTYFYNFGSATAAVNQNIQVSSQGNNTDNFRTGATTGYLLNYTSPGSSTRFYWTPTPYSIKYIGMDYTDMSPSKFYGQDIYSGSPTLTSVSYPTGITSYSGKTINGMGIGGHNYAGTSQSLSNVNQEVYEILVYDTKLSTNDANQVMDYLRGKWNHVVDLSNTAIFDATVTGKTTNANDFFWFSNFNSPISAVGNFYWTTQGMKFLLDGNTDAYFNRGLVTANLGFNYSVSDSGNNIIETATCQKTPTGAILYSAGTYNISIEYDYNCVDPSPTPTPTETITPSPTPTMTPTPSSVPFDSDAATYLAAVISAGGSVDATISGATNTLFTDLKTNGLYSKIDIMYPYVGGVANSNKINAKNPGTFDITFGAGYTHNYSGTTSNGSSLANTNYTAVSPTDNLNSNHFSLYIGTTGSTYVGGAVYIMEFGNMDTLFNGNFLGVLLGVEYNVDGGQTYFGNMTASLKSVSKATMGTSLGFIGASRENSTSWFLNKNGSNIATDTNTRNQVFPSNPLGNPTYIPAFSGNIVSGTRRHQFATFGDGLSSGEMAQLETIINTFQTTLGRNTY